jgi:hypothetical protein
MAPAWVAAAFTLGCAGCFSWRPYEQPAPLSQPTGLPSPLRVTLADSSQAELHSPFVRADTLYGRSGPRRDTLAIAVTAVRGLERERLSVWRTLGVTTVVAPAGALLAIVAIALAGDR